MTGDAPPGEGKRPRLAPHVRLFFDRRREQWVIQAPERVLFPDEIALAIVQRCDGARTMPEIIDDLAREFDAPREEIARDVSHLIEHLGSRGVLVS